MSMLEPLVSAEGDTLDALLWRERALGPEHIAKVLDINPALAAIGAMLPTGTIVMVPPPPASATPILPSIQLWS